MAIGKKTGGRQRGTPNRTTALLKDAIIKAAEAVGEDGKGRGKLVGYCKMLAKNEPKAFSSLLGRVLPMQVTGEGGQPIVTRVEHVIVDAADRDA